MSYLWLWQGASFESFIQVSIDRSAAAAAGAARLSLIPVFVRAT